MSAYLRGASRAFSAKSSMAAHSYIAARSRHVNQKAPGVGADHTRHDRQGMCRKQPAAELIRAHCTWVQPVAAGNGGQVLDMQVVTPALAGALNHMKASTCHQSKLI